MFLITLTLLALQRLDYVILSYNVHIFLTEQCIHFDNKIIYVKVFQNIYSGFMFLEIDEWTRNLFCSHLLKRFCWLASICRWFFKKIIYNNWLFLLRGQLCFVLRFFLLKSQLIYFFLPVRTFYRLFSLMKWFKFNCFILSQYTKLS